VLPPTAAGPEDQTELAAQAPPGLQDHPSGGSGSSNASFSSIRAAVGSAIAAVFDRPQRRTSHPTRYGDYATHSEAAAAGGGDDGDGSSSSDERSFSSGSDASAPDAGDGSASPDMDDDRSSSGNAAPVPSNAVPPAAVGPQEARNVNEGAAEDLVDSDLGLGPPLGKRGRLRRWLHTSQAATPSRGGLSAGNAADPIEIVSSPDSARSNTAAQPSR